MKRATIDRFEDDVAVLLVDGREEHRARSSLPPGAAEGDVVDLDTNRLLPQARQDLLARLKAARKKLPR